MIWMSCWRGRRSRDDDERKDSRDNLHQSANDLPDHRRPGVVFIGARDNGSPSGLAVTDDLLLQLADIKSDGNIVPPPTLTVARHTLRGVDVAVITVWPADSPPVRYKGRIHIRIGPRRGIASAQDERILNERRRYRDRPFDVQPMPSATLDDLDRARFESEYLPAAVARDVLEAKHPGLQTTATQTWPKPCAFSATFRSSEVDL